MAREQAFTLHHYAVRGNMSLRSNIRTIEQHRAAAHRRAAANHYTVNLKDSIFKSVSLKLTAHSSSILELQHIGIDYLSEPAAQNNSLPYPCPHRAEIPRQK